MAGSVAAAASFADRSLRRFGLIALATDLTTERDAARLLPEGTALHVTRIAFDNPTTPENLRATGPRLRAAAALLVPGVPLAGIGFACTSAGAVLGDELPRLIGDDRAPVTTPGSGAVRAFAALGARRIALLTPYLAETTLPVRAYFQAEGIEVVATHSLGHADDRDMAGLGADALIAAALAADHPDAQAMFISCTALAALDVIPKLERRLQKPVLSANLALYWAMLDQAGIAASGPFRLMAARTW